MTPAEKMAQRLNSAKCDEGVDGQMLEDAATMIRRLAAALLMADDYLSGMAEKEVYEDFLFCHADALRDVKEMP